MGDNGRFEAATDTVALRCTRQEAEAALKAARKAEYDALNLQAAEQSSFSVGDVVEITETYGYMSGVKTTKWRIDRVTGLWYAVNSNTVTIILYATAVIKNGSIGRRTRTIYAHEISKLRRVAIVPEVALITTHEPGPTASGPGCTRRKTT